MARTTEEGNERIINVPLRRLLTGVPRTQRAAASIPRIKKFVRRNVKRSWLEAVRSDDEPDGKLWIDDSLNMTIWGRGREHVAGPAEWEEPKGGGPAHLARRTSVRYGSILKVRVFFNETPKDGGDPRLELTLPGIEHITRQERRERKRAKASGEADEEEGAEEGSEEEELETDEDEEEAEEEEEVKAPPAKPVKKEAPPAAPKKEAPAATPKKEATPAAPKKEVPISQTKKEATAAPPKKKAKKPEGED